MLCIALDIDAGSPAAGLARARRVELVDPRGHAIDGPGRKRVANRRHRCAALTRPAKLGDQVRACRVAWNDADFATTKCRLTAVELKLEVSGFEVETACAVIGAMATAIDAARLEDLLRDLL